MSDVIDITVGYCEEHDSAFLKVDDGEVNLEAHLSVGDVAILAESLQAATERVKGEPSDASGGN